MLYKRIVVVITLLFFGCISQIYAQDTDKIPFDQGVKYILADIAVK